MSKSSANQPVALRPPAAPLDLSLDEVLAEPLAQDPPGAAAAPLRHRLLSRVARSLAAEAGMHTARARQLPSQAIGTGVTAKTLYQASATGALRPGEPLRCQLLQLAPGAQLASRDLAPLPQLLRAGPAPADTPPGWVREWLVLSGELQLCCTPASTAATSATASPNSQPMALRDYHRSTGANPDADATLWSTRDGAQLFLRESWCPAGATSEPGLTVRDGEAGWPDFAPGIQRRVLWHGQGQASMLYLAAPGAQVPNHTHGHDEECLMVQGELFLDDVLLLAGDYQLAPAGTGHRLTHTDTGVVIFAHGDQDLQFC